MGSLVGLWRTRLPPSMLGESEWIERAQWLYLSYALVHMSMDPQLSLQQCALHIFVHQRQMVYIQSSSREHCCKSKIFGTTQISISGELGTANMAIHITHYRISCNLERGERCGGRGEGRKGGREGGERRREGERKAFMF